MNRRVFTIYVWLIGAVCTYVVVRRMLAPDALTLGRAVVQGFFVGFGLAVVTIEIVARRKTVTVNGWVTAFGCGRPTNGMFTRAAHARLFPGPINLPEEAMYWRTSVDGAGKALSGAHQYRMHFPPGGLPPNRGFWSLTMADAHERFVANPLNRFLLGDRSALAPNADGSIDICIQHSPPAGHRTNWLPAPRGDFKLWLRAYRPGDAILEGAYVVPPVVRT